MLLANHKPLLSTVFSSCLLALGITLSPPTGGSSKVPVLMYHEISPADVPGDDVHISLSRFRGHMRYLADNGYRTLTLDELVAMTEGQDIDDKAVVITLDDGWKSQLKVLPILRHYNFKAVFFVFPGKGIEDPWGDYMDWNSLREISDDPNFEVQAHSMTHPWAVDSNLVTWVNGETPGKGISDAEYELMESKVILQQRLNTPVNYFAWPAGLYNSHLINMARDAGYDALFTVVGDGVTTGTDKWEIPRVFVDGSCEINGFVRMLEAYKTISCSSEARAYIRNSDE